MQYLISYPHFVCVNLTSLKGQHTRSMHNYNTLLICCFQREILKYEDEDRSDGEEEKPTVVVLKDGDLTADEAAQLRETGVGDEVGEPGDGDNSGAGEDIHCTVEVCVCW